MSFFSNLFNQRRTEMRKVAEELGMDFYDSDNYDLVAYLNDYQLFSRGRSRKIKNMLICVDGEEGLDIRIFDYRFVTGGGNATRVHNQTVFYLYSEKLGLPQFMLEPENFFHRIGKFLGMPDDINFEEYPEFSKQYLLKGEQEAAVRSAFKDDLLHFFTIEKNWNLEGRKFSLVFYAEGKRHHPETIKDFYEKGRMIYNMLTNEKGFGGYGEFV